jgi:hypothetical protein
MTLDQSKTFWEKFSNIIDRSAIGAAVERRRELINRTDPRRIYPENIRSFFHIPLPLAQWLLELAVKEGIFQKRIGYLCPNDDCHSMIADVSADEQPFGPLICESCEALERENYVFEPGECRQVVFYRLGNAQSDDGS